MVALGNWNPKNRPKYGSKNGGNIRSGGDVTSAENILVSVQAFCLSLSSDLLGSLPYGKKKSHKKQKPKPTNNNPATGLLFYSLLRCTYLQLLARELSITQPSVRARLSVPAPFFLLWSLVHFQASAMTFICVFSLDLHPRYDQLSSNLFDV